ncbi:MAG: cation diffusion facilitator family transporter [Rhizomicrobium sp.]|jgi:ferrous-iron efflux pump FieF
MMPTASQFDRTVAEHGPLMRRVALAAVVTAAFLVAIKTLAFILTDSMAMMASLADSALDVFASFVNLLAVRTALTPADREHRFGHGKAEPLAGLAQSAFIAGSSAFLVIESTERLLEPRPIEHGTAGLVVMGISIAATVVLVTAQQVVVRRTKSIAIGADRMHYLSDILVNVGVVIGIVLATNFGILIADPIVGLLVAAVLAVGVWHVFRQSYNQLMDRELPDADRERIKQIVMGHPAVRDMHDLRTRAAGVHAFIQVHIELDPALSLMSAHAVADEVEAALGEAFPNAEVIIHEDPEGYEAVAGLAKS